MRIWNGISRCVALFILIFLSFPPCTAQSADYWAPLPKEDILLSDNPMNPGASAMILDRRVESDDKKRLQTEWIRIKIFKPEGTKYADVQIPYSNKFTVEDVRGRTVRQDGTVIEFNGIVFEKTIVKYKRLRYQVKTFTLPGAEAGAVIEYSFTLRWKDNLPDYVRNPEQYRFEGAWAYPTATWTIQHDLFTRHVVFVLRPFPKLRLQWIGIRLAQAAALQPDESVRLELSNVPPIVEEEQMPPTSFLESSVHFFYTGKGGSYTFGGASSYWWDYGRLIEKEMQRFTSSTPYLSRVAREIAPETDPPETRLRKLYARIQQLRYLSNEPTRTEKEVKRQGLSENKSAEDIWKHGYARANEVNFLFVALARSAGFEADIVETNDRRTNLFERQIPDPSQLRAVVVRVSLSGKLLFLDPATRFCPFGMLPWYESDTTGIPWTRFGSPEMYVPGQGSQDATTTRTADFRLSEDGTLRGTVTVRFEGVEAIERRLSALDEDENGRRKAVEDELRELLPPTAELESTSVTGWDGTEQPLEVRSNVTISSYAAVSQHRIAFPTTVFHSNRSRPISTIGRVQSVNYDYAYFNHDLVNITLPPKYVVEALPKDSRFEDGAVRYQVARSVKDGKVQMDRRFELNRYYFGVNDYRKLWGPLVKARIRDAENLVLQRNEVPAQ
jgi:hypothetical protein